MQFIHQHKRLISKHKSCVRQQAVLRKDKGGGGKTKKKEDSVEKQGMVCGGWGRQGVGGYWGE